MVHRALEDNSRIMPTTPETPVSGCILCKTRRRHMVCISERKPTKPTASASAAAFRKPTRFGGFTGRAKSGEQRRAERHAAEVARVRFESIPNSRVYQDEKLQARFALTQAELRADNPYELDDDYEPVISERAGNVIGNVVWLLILAFVAFCGYLWYIGSR